MALHKDEQSLDKVIEELKQLRQSLAGIRLGGNNNSFTLSSGAVASTVCVVATLGAFWISSQQSAQLATQAGTIAAQQSQIADQQQRLSELQRRSDRTQDHMETIYMLIPELRKMVESKLKEEKRAK